MDMFSSFLAGQGIGLFLFLLYILIFVFCGFGLFYLLVRPVILWYFKINKLERSLEENNRLQSQILEQLKILNCWHPADFGPESTSSDSAPQRPSSSSRRPQGTPLSTAVPVAVAEPVEASRRPYRGAAESDASNHSVKDSTPRPQRLYAEVDGRVVKWNMITVVELVETPAVLDLAVAEPVVPELVEGAKHRRTAFLELSQGQWLRCSCCLIVESLSDSFVRRLIDGAQVITICREPDCCGSIGDSCRILELLDSHFFDGQLGTDMTL